MEIMNHFYILDKNDKPVPVEDMLTWGKWFEGADRTVAKTEISDMRISTVFLGIDHSDSEGPPILYETMIFGGEHEGYQDRYATREEAVAGHMRATLMCDPKWFPGMTRPTEETFVDPKPPYRQINLGDQ